MGKIISINTPTYSRLTFTVFSLGDNTYLRFITHLQGWVLTGPTFIEGLADQSMLVRFEDYIKDIPDPYPLIL